MPWGKKARKTEEGKSNEKDKSQEEDKSKAEVNENNEKSEPHKRSKSKDAPTEEPKVAKKSKKSEIPLEITRLPETTTEEIEKFVQDHVGSSDISQSIQDLLKNSSCPRVLLDSAIGEIFKVMETDPSQFEWGRSAIQALSSDLMEPKKRLREAHFFPNPLSEKNVVKHLLAASKKMIICVFAMTNDTMANAIRECKGKGVDIRMIFDDEMMNQPGSDVKALIDEGYQIRIDLDPKAHMHNKFVVIDDKTVITGSYNWTKQASTKNHENVVIFEDTEIAKMYTSEFNKLWEEFADSLKGKKDN